MKLGLIFMAKIYFFVDGFNLYHALDNFANGPDHHRYRKYKWISLTRLAACFITKRDTLAGVDYFTALATWDAGKVSRHNLFIKAQENEGVNVIYGQFKKRDRYCNRCKHWGSSVEEKETDVNIALRLLQLAIQDR